MIPADRWTPSAGLTLEPNALRAAKETVRNLALTAGPGAGKTEMLAQRADFLLRTGSTRYPRRILAISFKVDAAQNLKARVRKRCGPELASRLDSYTFHAFGKRLIDKFRPVLKGADALNADYSVGERRVQNQSITFKDMVPLALRIVSTSEIARTAIRQTYSHVFLDEFQDCTGEQYDLIKSCFLGSQTIITSVGDTKQRIMGWAGAVEGIFQTFAADFNAQSLNLYQNFRSAPRLRRMQNAMVRTMDPAAAVPDADIVGSDGLVEVHQFGTDVQEADGITNLIGQLVQHDGTSLSEIAVLVSKQQSLYCQKLTSALDAAGIPYREEDASQDLASEPVARLIVDFLQTVAGGTEVAPHRRLLDILVFSLGLDEEHEYQELSRLNRLIASTRAEIIDGTIDLRDATDLNALVDRLLGAVGRDKVVAMSSDYASAERLDGLITDTIERAYGLMSGAASPAIALAAFSGDEAVRIMSIHKSKGLEFDAVFILGVEDQTFWGQLPAERSAYFVGISRAKKSLFLTHSDQRSRPAGHGGPWSIARTGQAEFLGYAAAAV
jgi:superfamily I DNA/RNA helicase